MQCGIYYFEGDRPVRQFLLAHACKGEQACRLEFYDQKHIAWIRKMADHAGLCQRAKQVAVETALIMRKDQGRTSMRDHGIMIWNALFTGESDCIIGNIILKRMVRQEINKITLTQQYKVRFVECLYVFFCNHYLCSDLDVRHQ